MMIKPGGGQEGACGTLSPGDRRSGRPGFRPGNRSVTPTPI